MMNCISIEADRQMQPCKWQAGLQVSLWYCVLTATAECIDTFYRVTSVTDLGAAINGTVINEGCQGSRRARTQSLTWGLHSFMYRALCSSEIFTPSHITFIEGQIFKTSKFP